MRDVNSREMEDMDLGKAPPLRLPKMRMIRQSANIPPAVDVLSEINREWRRIKDRLPVTSGASVAICVGSRGIANLTLVVGAVAALLKTFGYRPFVTTAMGSHGGATAGGQIELLRARGISEDTVGVPVRATMDVVFMGEVKGIPLFLDRFAHEADGIVLINRVKPHTSFIGPTESGLIKMMSIGLGNQVGAEHYHRLSVVRSQYEIISAAGKELINKSSMLFGVGLFENQRHETAALKMALAHEIETVEADLLKRARNCLATLPVDEMDLLIIDEMGKEISGGGIDPNVTGREVIAYAAKRSRPKITRIFVRDLTNASEGSAIGIGRADFTTRRLVDKIDFQSTAINCLTACAPEAGKIPLTYPDDRSAIEAALMTLRPGKIEAFRIVQIKNTLALMTMFVSNACLPELIGNPEISVDQDDLELEFGDDGNLVPRDLGV